MEYLLSILLALFLTLIVETPLYFFLLKIKRKSSLLTLILMNVFTNVLMNLTYIHMLLQNPTHFHILLVLYKKIHLLDSILNTHFLVFWYYYH